MSYRPMLWVSALLLCLLGFMMSPGWFGIFLLLAAQAAVFGTCLLERTVSATGSFTFMYILFFGFRPLYFFIEGDWGNLTRHFLLPREIEIPYNGLCWATASLIAFNLGALLPTARRPLTIFKNYLKRQRDLVYVLRTRDVVPLLLIQVLTLFILMQLSGDSLYTFRSGYIYDLPIPMQALHLFSVLFILGMHRMAPQNPTVKWGLWASVLLFIIFTIEMRSVTMFRSFYLTGFLVLYFGFLASRQKRVTYKWLILPIVLALPVFDVLGRSRFEDTGNVAGFIRSNIHELITPRNYWDFFEGGRDMNIYDSYVAALNFNPEKRPYFKQWLYPLVHVVPRQLWKSKPEGGILIDMSVMRGAPLSPGIPGIFYLGGGHAYMLFSMALLGYLVARVYATILGMREGVLKWTFYGTFVINSMLLTRFFLFQFFWQILYVAVPIFVLHTLLIRKFHKKSKRQRMITTRPRAELQPGAGDGN